jgi:uncharacterized protein YutE (UPF0331/DUF86 family)
VVTPDVAKDKIAAIERHVARVEEVRRGRPGLLPLEIEEMIHLNLFAAAQACLELASHVVSSEGYGVPATLAESFTLLEKRGVIDADLGERLRRMAGFRNIFVHRYTELDKGVIDRIVRNNLGDLRRFAAVIVSRFGLDR